MRSIYEAIFLLVDHASAPFIYCRMIECAKTWDETLRERRDSLLNCLNLTDQQTIPGDDA
ncbi:hypothetical protein NC653_023722 [Populus alba x Populus x berolinensis]|uniref:Uncharacterized protein n=1 Tax=Populus alba x Populus x berolinensis TaxID=444605 RepID=A0AAD6MHX7_9ROSI|nr:hypothetical protein NC653_023722 [Populus alba x Populus x berolinensis]